MPASADEHARRFSQEMLALDQEGAAFAAEFPEAARLLDARNLEDRDPYVERITEGVASLVGRIRQIAGTEELDQELLAMFAPELVQPLPSVSVVRFQSIKPLVRSVVVPEGAVVRSKPVADCPSGMPFRLLHEVEVTPTRLETATMELDERGHAHLDWTFAWKSKRGSDAWPDRIPIYLLADAPVVWALRHGLCRKLDRAEVEVDGRWEAIPGLRFVPSAFAGYTTENDFASPLAHARDFLCADDRFRFVELRGLSGSGVGVNRELRLRLHLSGNWSPVFCRGIRASVFQLHCGVVVNRNLEPLQGIHWDHTMAQCRVRPLGGARREILEIRSVVGIGMEPPRRRISYAPYGYRKLGGTSGWFGVIRDTGPAGEPVVRLGLGGTDAKVPLENQYLAIDGVCGDGDLPHDTLGAGDLCRPGRGVPKEIGLQGLVRPGPSHRPASPITPRTALLALSQGHTMGWLDAERLKDGLRQVLWEGTAAKRTLIEAIQEVGVSTGFELDAGVAWRVMDVEIRLRDATCTPDTWDRIGILDAFGSILFAFVRDATEVGSRSRLRVLVEPAGLSLDYGAIP